jgi:hypothetical protein
MSKRKKPPERPPAPPPPPPPKKRYAVGVGVGIVVLAAIALVGRAVLRPASAASGLPAARQQIATVGGPTFADFVGADACGECHTEKYNAWKSSTHGQAGGAPTRDRVIAPFNGQPLRFRDAVVTPSVSDRGTFVFTVAQRDRPVQRFEVHAVVGGGHMVGGGTQAYFAKFPDGTVRFLPFDYSKTERVFFGALPELPAMPWQSDRSDDGFRHAPPGNPLHHTRHQL